MILELSYPKQIDLLDSIVKHMKIGRQYSKKIKNHWLELTQTFKHLGLEKGLRDILIFWVISQSHQKKEGKSKTRLLHPLETKVLTPQAYGYLLELTQIGVLNQADFNKLIENASENIKLPIDHIHIKDIVIYYLEHMFLNYPFNTSH